MTRTEKLVLDCLEIRRHQLRSAVAYAVAPLVSDRLSAEAVAEFTGISRHAVYRALIELGYTVDAPTDAAESEES